MTLKGRTFTHEDLPRMTQQRLKNQQIEAAPVQAYLDRQTERYKIVALDGDTPIIAEELNERLMRRWAETAEGEIDSAVLVQLRNLMTLTQDQRVQLLDAFDREGELINDFSPPSAPEKPAKKAKK